MNEQHKPEKSIEEMLEEARKEAREEAQKETQEETKQAVDRFLKDIQEHAERLHAHHPEVSIAEFLSVLRSCLGYVIKPYRPEANS